LGSHYQEEDWDPIIKRRKVGIPLSREGRLGSHYQEKEGWDPIIKRRKVGIPLSILTLPHFCACPKPGPGFLTAYVVILLSVQ
jgi:hypothetical protein